MVGSKYASDFINSSGLFLCENNTILTILSNAWRYLDDKLSKEKRTHLNKIY